MDIDLEDVSSYPKAVMELYQEKKKYDSYLKRKEDKIKKIENNFHKFVEKRIMDTAELRKKRGLRVGNEWIINYLNNNFKLKLNQNERRSLNEEFRWVDSWGQKVL